MVLAMCVILPQHCMILGRHRVHPFGHTAHMRYPTRHRDYSKGNFLSHLDEYQVDDDKTTMLTDDPSAYGSQEDKDDTVVYYRNSYGAHMDDIFKNNFNYPNKYTKAHIEEPYIEVFHKPSHSNTKKKKTKKKNNKSKDYPEMLTVDFQRVRKVLKKEKLVVSTI